MNAREYLDLAVKQHAEAVAAYEASQHPAAVLAARMQSPGAHLLADAAARASLAAASAQIATALAAEERRPKWNPPNPTVNSETP